MNTTHNQFKRTTTDHSPEGKMTSTIITLGRKPMLDESMLSSDEARKLEERRASNRQAAAKGVCGHYALCTVLGW